MKRISDVFELPCDGVDIQGSDVYYSQTEREKMIDDKIAHAINHVDALADALLGAAALLSSAGFESSDEYQSAILAIRSYRGSHD